MQQMCAADPFLPAPGFSRRCVALGAATALARAVLDDTLPLMPAAALEAAAVVARRCDVRGSTAWVCEVLEKLGGDIWVQVLE